MNLTIRTKIFLGMFAVSLIFIIISIFIMNLFMSRLANNEVTHNLRVGKRAYERFIDLRYNFIISQARSMAQTPHLRAVMSISDVDHETIFYTAQEIYKAVEMDLMLLVDDQGKLLADVDDSSFYGHDLLKLPGVEEGLNGVEYYGIWPYRDNLYRISLTPIVMGDQVLGLLILGDILDSEAATEIREFTGRDVMILHSGKMISQSRGNPASSLVFEEEITPLVNLLENIESSNNSLAAPFRVILGGKECLAVAVPFMNSEGYTVLFRALDEVESELEVLRNSVLDAGGFSVILMVILSLWISARVTRPILQLRDAAEQFGAGRLGKRVTIHTKDELGELGETFNRMATILQERTHELTTANEALKHEITERKQAEIVRSKLEAKLRQSQKMEAIGTLAGGIAHDFNNILWVILGNTEMSLRKLPKDSPIRPKLQEILIASNRAKELVGQILTFSRQDEQECKPVQIHLIVQEALQLLKASLPSTIEIRQNIKDCRTVLANPTQIHQVIMNLCTNAYQAMGEFGGLLEVSMDIVEIDAKSIKNYPELQIGSYVEITISDTGCGMDRATVDRIFDPFFTTKEVGEGTGMGLATVHGIVTDMGGAIKVYSEPGKGSTFRIFLPRHDRSVSDESEAQTHNSDFRGDEHILIVDDEKQVVTLVQDMLEGLGYKVTTQTSGMEALKQFHAQPDRFDLVITDQTMPEMTGIDLAKKLIRIRPDIPIILTTGFSKMVTEKKIKDIGIREYLKKPVIFQDLEYVIRRVLDNKKD